MSETTTKPVRTVSVREMVEFVLRRGDLNVERPFVGSDRAMAGIRGHQKLQRSRPAGYQAEVPIDYSIEHAEFRLHIRGRIDGILPLSDETVLEEIKTVVGTWSGQPSPLHLAQAKIYGFVYARQQGLFQLGIQLTYLHLETEELTEFRESMGLNALEEFFTATTAVYLQWMEEQHRWEQERNRSLRDLRFPFPRYRPGQRESAVAVYRIMTQGGRLFLAAPTGIGKTVSVLFPTLKALGEGTLDHLFYLTARTIGRAVAEQTLDALRQEGLKLRSVTITAKEKMCVPNGVPCDPMTCPLARGYYDRLHAALREVLELESMTRGALDAISRQHQVCPFELSLDAAVWSDTIICDYNYVFDPQVYLRRFFDDDSASRHAFLVDEAHNLVDRARDIFSADLNIQEIREVKRVIQKALPRCARSLGKLARELTACADPAASQSEEAEESNSVLDLELFPDTPSPQARPSENTLPVTALPSSLLGALEKTLLESEKWLARNEPSDFREALLELFFRLRSFQRTAETYDEHFTTLVTGKAHAVSVRLFCIDPSALMREALRRGKSTVFFSATLAPIDYYRDLLGGEAQDPVLQLASPFASDQLLVIVHDRIQTSFNKRAQSLGDVVTSIGNLIQGRRGNYLIYFPSYQYLNDVHAAFRQQYPQARTMEQRPGMTEAEREQFLASFAHDAPETLVGFAVLGGIFGEGIDLVGERLIGAAIVSVGLPQLCLERDRIREHFDQLNGSGFDYAYAFPGMNRILQAMGRVIRTEADRGVVLLIDARFSQKPYRELLPPWWQLIRVSNIASLTRAMESFWNTGNR